MLRRFSLNFAIFAMALDAILTAGALWTAAAIRPALNRLPFIVFISAPVEIPPSLYLLFPSLWVLIFFAFSIYDGRRYLRAADEFAALSLAMLIASVSGAGLLYMSYRQISRALFLLFLGLDFLFLVSWRILAQLWFSFQRSAAGRERRVLVVGAGPLGQAIREKIAQAGLNAPFFVGFVDDCEENDPGGACLGRLDAIRDLIRRHQVTDVVIALPYSEYAQLGRVIEMINDLPVGVWIALGFFDLALYRTAIEDFVGIPMLDLRASAIDDYQRLLKRAFDLVFGSIALLFSLPLMGLIALAILLQDGPPVLFRQVRVGENGRLFEMLKFRTMVKNAEQMRDLVEYIDQDGNLIHKTRNDPRVTPLGRFLRRFSLDELPQLFNVLRGEMSLVGPRPELPYLVEKYQPWQRQRFAVPPGITGWWQVTGRSDKPMHLHTEDDLFYIRHYSIWLDIQILIRTVWVVLIGRGSY
uniref:Exopolysaccharide biosynthesis polyprenyl glycosylphosphotransferase n=1 Tax=uncultured Chloroflexota bacterium TaxID=166587 RepID=H5SIC4_9CHLR|nr:exopolysaccharide biosynthesis polyprenyl glycosylphosphotransferase [uncultured Chloroflexota bacterium]BAL55910.1 exopolysaccharide biosynthesis polyprenyl glycosylphosphotransferase [uncultured Chloroflexota bacterium]